MEKKIVVKIKQASFYKAFGKSLNLMRPVGEFTEEEVGKLSDDIKKGLIEIIGEESIDLVKSAEPKDPAQNDLSKEHEEIKEYKKEEEIKTEEIVENKQPVEDTVEKEIKTRGRKAN